MNAFASFVTGRRTKWLVVVAWVVAVAALSPLGSKLADVTEDDTASFLPESAESTEVVNGLDSEFEAGETTQGLIVYQRDGGLTKADEKKIAEDAAALQKISEEDHDELPLVRLIRAIPVPASIRRRQGSAPPPTHRAQSQPTATSR